VTGSRVSGVWVLFATTKIATLAVITVAVLSQLAAATEPSSAAKSPVRAVIDNAWVRAMPPSQVSTAAYLSVHNIGDSRLKIVGASSQSEAIVEIHTSREVDGMVSMQALEEVILAPGQRLEFAPGGMHLMMLGLDKMPAPGEKLKLCLEFDGGASVCTLAEVRRAAASPGDKTHSAHQHH